MLGHESDTNQPRSRRQRNCGSSPTNRRRGLIRTRKLPVRKSQSARACSPTRALGPIRVDWVTSNPRLEVEVDAYAGIPCWSGEQAWVEKAVREAYKAHYLQIRPQLLDKNGVGGVSLKAVLAVAREMARVADWETGRESRPTVKTLMEHTGLGETTVQSARRALKLLGVATEVLRGRQRTKLERLISHKAGDRSRGWASVWALHQPRPPVDKTRVVVAGHIQMGPHPRRGVFKPLSFFSKNLSTGKTVNKRAASRRTGTKVGVEKADATRRGMLLAARWLGNARTPVWARRHTPRGWAAALTEPAAHGWTAVDLNDVIDTWATARRITPDPQHPIAFIRWLMKEQDLAFAPHVLAQIAADQETAERERQAKAFETERGRYANAAADDSPGRQAARLAAHLATGSARTRRIEDSARENEARAEWITHRRMGRQQ